MVSSPARRLSREKTRKAGARVINKGMVLSAAVPRQKNRPPVFPTGPDITIDIDHIYAQAQFKNTVTIPKELMESIGS